MLFLGVKWVRLHWPYLRLIMWHMLDQRLIGKLLRAVGNVLSGVSGRGGYNGWSCRGGRVHHGALMMLVLSLLGHIWYYRKEKETRKWTLSTIHAAVWSPGSVRPDSDPVFPMSYPAATLLSCSELLFRSASEFSCAVTCPSPGFRNIRYGIRMGGDHRDYLILQIIMCLIKVTKGSFPKKNRWQKKPIQKKHPSLHSYFIPTQLTFCQSH